MPALAEEARDSNERASGELKKFFDDVEELLKRVTHSEDLDVAKLRRRLESSLQHARDGARRGLKQARESASVAAESADDYVHERPWAVIGAAAVAGVLLGAALTRR
jgi:ElaB/YqjD/DUF883 family membrane-anchored ribosome-binding protein